MTYTIRLKKIREKYPEAVCFFKFIALMSLLYYFNIFYIAITDPQGRIYSAFLHRFFDYISWIRTSILYTSNLIAHAFGFRSYIANVYTIKIPQGPGVIIGLTCIGWGVMSFWIAFVAAQNAGWQQKVIWCLAGIVAIWFINCWRIALLLTALANKWQVNKYMDHHEMFNLAIYSLIMTMMVGYYRSNRGILSSEAKAGDR